MLMILITTMVQYRCTEPIISQKYSTVLYRCTDLVTSHQYDTVQYSTSQVYRTGFLSPEHSLCSEDPGRDLATHKEVVTASLLTEVARPGAGVERPRGHQVLDLLTNLLTGLGLQGGREVKPSLL